MSLLSVHVVYKNKRACVLFTRENYRETTVLVCEVFFLLLRRFFSSEVLETIVFIDWVWSGENSLSVKYMSFSLSVNKLNIHHHEGFLFKLLSTISQFSFKEIDFCFVITNYSHTYWRQFKGYNIGHYVLCKQSTR